MLKFYLKCLLAAFMLEASGSTQLLSSSTSVKMARLSSTGGVAAGLGYTHVGPHTVS